MIDLGLGPEEPVQRHVRRPKLAQNLFLLVARAHAAELRDEIADHGFLPAGSRMLYLLLMIARNQRPGVALDLVHRVPVSRGSVAGPVFAPAWIGGRVIKVSLAVDTEDQGEMRIDPNEL
jgi:hypothetical protein